VAITQETSIDGMVWLANGNGARLGYERLRLLEEIAATGSISQAARNLELSYKAAWDAVNAINNLADEPLVVRQAGGRHGGGTQVTPAGLQLIEMFRQMEGEWRELLASMDRHLRDFAGFQQLMQRLSMRTSARNQLQGKVLEIKRGVVGAQVTLALSDKEQLVAVITNDSVDTLGLTEGREVYALIKASFVTLTPADDCFRTSARNRLTGTISAVRNGPVNSEVVLDLDGGKTIAAVITRESVQTLGLATGERAAALIKAAHVILGVA
jgi:molybdate transport system regulatory protein